MSSTFEVRTHYAPRGTATYGAYCRVPGCGWNQWTATQHHAEFLGTTHLRRWHPDEAAAGPVDPVAADRPEVAP